MFILSDIFLHLLVALLEQFPFKFEELLFNTVFDIFFFVVELGRDDVLVLVVVFLYLQKETELEDHVSLLSNDDLLLDGHDVVKEVTDNCNEQVHENDKHHKRC